MKRKEFILVNCLVFGVIGFFSLLTIRLSINQSLGSLVKDFASQEMVPQPIAAASADTAKCTTQAPLNLSGIKVPEIQKLKEYQDLCGSLVTRNLMFFTGFSENRQTAEANAAQIAAKLKQFHQAGLSPIVIVEPYISDRPMSFRDFENGLYDKSTGQFFSKLKQAGVTDDMMGVWVPFPEPNTPQWNNAGTEPHDFALCVNRYLRQLKAVFPGAKGSVLLSAITFEPSDVSWDNGDYLNLVPYLQDIDKTLVTSLGIQGFPWVSNAQAKYRSIFRASEFLQPDLAIAAAQELRTRDIWFNTGSFAAKYTGNPQKTRQVSSADRKAILDGILEEVQKLHNYQQNEYRVSVNLFAENKSATPEATDWSYFADPDSRTILKSFFQQAGKLNVPITLFDRTH